VNSAIYEGWVKHHRLAPVAHGFRYRLFLPLFDLDELPELLDPIPLWSARRPAPARFRRDDYLANARPSLPEEARDLVEERLGRRPSGPVRLLANPRYFGVGFNPVSFLYLHDRAGETVDAVIAEVTSTPWRERATYVIDARRRDRDGTIEGCFDKAMHVSPFQPMRQRYEIALSEPREDLRVMIRNLDQGRMVFAASMALRRRELSPKRMARLLFGYPPMTAATLARIYGNALKLKLKGAQVHPRPELARR
jgi:uncharacterized protein